MKKKKEKKWKGPRIRKIVSLSKELQERPITKQRFRYSGPSCLHGQLWHKATVGAMSLDPLAASLTFSVLSSWCELLTRS